MGNKILLISPLPPPIGGIATWSTILLNFYLTKSEEFEISHQNTAIKYRSITDKSVFKRIVGGIRDAFAMISEFKRNILISNPDVIHLTSSASFALIKDVFLMQIAAKSKIPIITHFHFGRIPQLAEKRNWEWYLIRKIIKKSNQIIVIDKKSHDILNAFGFKNVVNIPNPISVELEAKSRKLQSNNLIRQVHKIVFIGHVVVAKGIFELVKSCLLIPQIVELTIIGPYEDAVKDELLNLCKIRDNGKWIKFMGTLDKNEVYYQLENASLLALPSYTEGFPNVILEAMALGCPVVATNVGAIPEMLNVISEAPSGICVSVKSVEELSDAISVLLSDLVKAKSMGDRGIEKILSNYTIANISSLYERVWINSLKKSND